jgi:hypothetical protein
MLRFLSALIGIFFRRDAKAYVERKAEEHPEDLDVGGSVVDLLKSLNQDSSYKARARLAASYGHVGYAGTEDDNIWLHAEIMRRVGQRRFP